MALRRAAQVACVGVRVELVAAQRSLVQLCSRNLRRSLRRWQLVTCGTPWRVKGVLDFYSCCPYSPYAFTVSAATPTGRLAGGDAPAPRADDGMAVRAEPGALRVR